MSDIEYRCPGCGQTVGLGFSPREAPTCNNRDRHSRRRKMVLVEGEPKRRAPRARRKHVASQVCGFCKKVITVGCYHERPCTACKSATGKPTKTRLVVIACEKCRKEGRKVPRGTKVDLEKVDSSNLDAAGYNPKRKIFAVRFRSGKIYEHDGVPHQTYAAFCKSESKGKAYNRLIKDRFAVRRVG